MKENNINTPMGELETMRQELSDFKALLKDQKIINETLMRKSMQGDYSKERQSVGLTLWLSVFAILAFAAMTFVMKVLPLWFFVLTVVYMAYCVAVTAYSVRRYVSDDLMTGNVITVAQHVLAYKRFGKRWLVFVGIPTLLVWLALFFYAISQQVGDSANGMILGGICGLVGGSICGTVYYIGSLRRVNRILAQIEEIKQMAE